MATFETRDFLLLQAKNPILGDQDEETNHNVTKLDITLAKLIKAAFLDL